MDDLDHSVLIAEQDWDCFCTESEECSVQQAKLAALEESGFSDIDDDKTSVYVSICEKDSVEEQKQHQIGECKIEHSSENSEFTGYPSPKTEPQNARSAEQMSDATENDPGATCECQNKANEDSKLTEKLHLKGNYEGQENDENIANQGTTEAVSETSSADIKHEDGIEMLTEGTNTSPVAQKEKERWFVTVNDSPICLRVKSPTSVQKKRRKKKTSKNLSKNSGVMEKCSSLNNNIEPDKEIIDRQTMQDKSEQENVVSDSQKFQNVLKIQDVICISPIRSCESEGDKTSYAISLKKESMTEMPEAKLERNPTDSLNSLLTPKQMPQKIFKDLSGPLPQYWDHESTVCDKYDKSTVDLNCECRHTTNNLSHFNNDTGVESILGAFKPPAPLDTEGERTEQQEPLGQSYNREEASQSSQETQSSSDSAKTLGPTPPIFAISSFWDEMEKLTINDILQLRIDNNKSLLTESLVPGEISHVDTHLLDRGEVESKDDSLEDGLVDDAADSDYFTHLDDSKPDRSSCEFSTYSDFDEEFLQLLHASANPSPEPLEGKEQTFLYSTSPIDLEETWQSESNKIIKLSTESDSPLYSETEAEMQDIFRTTKEDNNMSTFLLDHCSMRRPTPSPVLSISDFLDDQCLPSFFEILKGDTESEQYQAWIPDRNTSLRFSQIVSVAETYDDFFSDFEFGNLLFPSVQGSTKSEKTLVPIYSSSHSVVKDLEFPEVEKVMQLDEFAPIRVMRCASPSETSNMCFITSQRCTWRNLSLRHTKLLMGRTWCGMAPSWGFPKTADTVYSYGTTTSSSSSIAQPKLPVVLLENQALRQIKEHQIHVGAKVADADTDHFLFSLKQADMCLVCIAFASWVLKSSDPQSTDMWKAALLANVSAISAIQYLRRYIKEG